MMRLVSTFPSLLEEIEPLRQLTPALGAIMHKLLRVAFGVLRHNTPFVENFASL